MAEIIDATYEEQLFNGNIPWRVFELEPPDSRGCVFITDPHYANSIEFILTENIRGDAYIGGRRYVFGLDEKTAFYISPGIVHSLHYYEGSGQILICKLSISNLEKYINIRKIFPLGALESNEADHDFLKESFLLLADEKQPFYKKLTVIMQVFSLLNRSNTSLDQTSCSNHTIGLSFDELCTIIKWTEANLHRPVQLAEAAAQLGYNKNYFNQKFKESNHTTYLTYLNTARIRKACETLTETDSIEAVCNACGFQNESYFIKLFTRIVGITPGNYRKNIKEKSRY